MIFLQGRGSIPGAVGSDRIFIRNHRPSRVQPDRLPHPLSVTIRSNLSVIKKCPVTINAKHGAGDKRIQIRFPVDHPFGHSMGFNFPQTGIARWTACFFEGYVSKTFRAPFGGVDKLLGFYAVVHGSSPE